MVRIGVRQEDVGQWQKLVESGLVKGFSLEGAFNHIKLSNQDEMRCSRRYCKSVLKANKLMKRVDRVLMSQG